jgi:hypothetical protein
MENDRRQAQNTQQHESTTIPPGLLKTRDKPGNTVVISTRLLWIPIAIQLISGLTILIFPRLWQPLFLTLSTTYPELSADLSSSMLAVGTFSSLLAGINLFIMSAYLQKARWAWSLYLILVTIFWGGCLRVVMNAGITLAAILSIAVILLSWVGLGMSASEFFGSRYGAPLSKRSL